MDEQNKMDRIISDEEKRKKKIRTAVKATAISLVIGKRTKHRKSVENLPISAKNTTFGIVLTKNLPINGIYFSQSICGNLRFKRTYY